MADPTRYHPHFNYSGWEAAGPKRPKPGAELDIDFANIARSVDETIDALEDIRRSDGKLKNGIVDKDALDESSRELWESAEVAAEDAKGSAQSAAGAAASASTSAELARGYANDAVSQGNVPIYASAATVQGLEIPAGITALRTNGETTPGDGKGSLYVESDASSGTLQSGDGRWWAEAAVRDHGTFSSVAEVQSRHIPTVLESIRTLGRNSPGDGGGAEWVEGQESDPGATQSIDGKWWRPAPQGRVYIEQFGAIRDDIAPGYDSTPAIKAAIAYAASRGGMTVTDNGGVFNVSETIRIEQRGVSYEGSSYGGTTFAAMPDFDGDDVIVFGREFAPYYMQGSTIGNLVIECNGQEVTGLTVLTARDGCAFFGVKVQGNANVPGIRTGLSGGGTGVPGGLMCQGVQFLNCHVISQGPFISASMWQLDGLFESQLIGCKALSYGSSPNQDAVGFYLGEETETRGVAMIGCSVGNLAGGGGNLGIRYGARAENCWDAYTTYENIIGSAVSFDGGTDSGLLRPFNCQTLHPRLYPGAQGDASLNPAVHFGSAQTCRVDPIVQLSSASGARTAVLFDDRPVSLQIYNRVELVTTLEPDAMESSGYITFLGSANRNLVEGYSSAAPANRFQISNNRTSRTRYTSGASEQHDQFWSTFRLAPGQTGYRIRDDDGNTLAEFIRAIGGVNATGLTLLVNINGNISAQRVTLGDLHSGGDGYRVLRVPNS